MAPTPVGEDLFGRDAHRLAAADADDAAFQLSVPGLFGTASAGSSESKTILANSARSSWGRPSSWAAIRATAWVMAGGPFPLISACYAKARTLIRSAGPRQENLQLASNDLVRLPIRPERLIELVHCLPDLVLFVVHQAQPVTNGIPDSVAVDADQVPDHEHVRTLGAPDLQFMSRPFPELDCRYTRAPPVFV